MILLNYLEVLHYREFVTLLEQNIIIDIFQDIPLVFMAAILKIGIRTPLGILNGLIIDIFQDIPLVFMAAILKIGIRISLGILNGF